MNSNEIQSRMKLLNEEVNKVIKGKENIIEKVSMAMLASGHILLEDVPGLGKTTLAMTFSKALGFVEKRIQFTPDTMPSDIMGMSIYNEQSNAFEYNEGAAVNCHLLLGDEINRTSSKTQSALLEAMAEGKVTVDGVTHMLLKPFVVMATQNPITSGGTQPLPDSQLDRFTVQLSMGYPDRDSQLAILQNVSARDILADVKSVISPEEMVEMQDYVKNLKITEEVLYYIIDLCEATRNNESIRLGVSPRGVGALTQMTKARACMDGRDYVTPDDVAYVWKDVCAHRIFLDSRAKREGATKESVLDDIMKAVEAPKLLRKK